MAAFNTKTKSFTRYFKSQGDIASFETDVISPLLKCNLNINPLQTGTGDPSPTNPRPITGFTGLNITQTGKNLFDKTTVTEGKYLNSSGVISTSTGYYVSDYIKVKSGEVYVCSGFTPSGTAAYHCFYNESKQFDSSVVATTNPVTIPNGCSYIRLSIRVTGASLDDIQFEYGNIATQYNQYIEPTTYPIALGRTVYGGSPNVTTGELVVSYYKIKLNDCTPVYNSTNGFFGYYNSSSTPSAVLPEQRKTEGDIKCEIYSVYPTPISSITQIPNLPDKTIYYPKNSGNIYIKDSDYTTSADFLNAVGSYEMVYELATPQTYQLTPTEIATLLGENNIWHDANGDIDIKYRVL